MSQYITKFMKIIVLAAIVISVTVIFDTSTVMAEDNCQTCHDANYQRKLESSIHQKLDCTTCHQGFDQFPHPQLNASANSCETCHSKVVSDFRESVHSVLKCSNCHESSHEIKPVASKQSQVYRLHEVSTCANCHKDTVPYNSYLDSFHGIGNSLGSSKNATCSDCHTSHLILKQTDTRSSVHIDNVAKTCASCHKIAAKGFAEGKEHFEITKTGYSMPMYWTLKFFTWLTIIVITLLIIHMELELYRRLLNIRAKERGN